MSGRTSAGGGILPKEEVGRGERTLVGQSEAWRLETTCDDVVFQRLTGGRDK